MFDCDLKNRIRETSMRVKMSKTDQEKGLKYYFPLTETLGLGAPDSDFLLSIVVVVVPGDGGFDEGSEFGFDPSDPDLLFEAVVAISVSCGSNKK